LELRSVDPEPPTAGGRTRWRLRLRLVGGVAALLIAAWLSGAWSFVSPELHAPSALTPARVIAFITDNEARGTPKDVQIIALEHTRDSSFAFA